TGGWRTVWAPPAWGPPQPRHDIWERWSGGAEMALRHHAVNRRIRYRFLERKPVHFGLTPRPALTIHHRVGQRDDDGNFRFTRLTLAVNAAQELIVFSTRPRQDVQDQAAANVLQAIHARPNG